MKKILIAQFKHETNAFSPGTTDRTAYEARNAVIGETAIRTRFKGAKNETTGLLDFFSGKEGFGLIPVLAFDAMPGPRVDHAVFEEVRDRLLKVLDEQQVDGVLLSLHGAMVTTAVEDGEGALLEAIRKKVGAGVPIMATLDLHANITQKMVDHADALFVCDYYPHTDMYETGLRAAECMYHTLLGRVKPVMAWRKLPMIVTCTSTMEGTMQRLTRRFQEIRTLPGVLSANLAHGFFYANIYEQGMAAIVITDGSRARAEKLADDYAREVWEDRQQLKYEPLTADEGIDRALASDRFPVVLADAADNPGGGGTGDATGLLRRLVERQVDGAVMAAIYDPETTAQAAKAGVGATIDVAIGGKVAPEITGGPVCCRAYVKALTDGKYHNSGPTYHGLLMDHGMLAVLQVGTVTVLTGSIRVQAWDAELLRSCGIAPEEQKLIAVKSAIHYRGSYLEVTDRMFPVETPAAASLQIEKFDLDRCRRPMYPLDEEVVF